MTSAARRRLRRGRVIMNPFTIRIIAIALLTSAITAFLTLYIPNYSLVVRNNLLPVVSNYSSIEIVKWSAGNLVGGSSTMPLNVSISPPVVADSLILSNVSLSPPIGVDSSMISLNVSVLPPLVKNRNLGLNVVNSGAREIKKTAPLVKNRNLGLNVVNSGAREIKKTAPVRRRREPAYWRMSPNDALKYARKEIDNVELITEDRDLYAPLFKNISVFKRSYDLMEKILKIYIYRGGKRPIFHTPELRGIYASEGWFMKLLEENKKFVTPDSEKAHLFYLPYSSRQLQNVLYVPDSHDLKPLSVYLRDYVDWIKGRYPFWNRTLGADHFLVACHDWGPYTTTWHEELCKNTIKALCNADTSEGIFRKGKDVSLPETIIRNPRKPLRFIGSGRPVSQRSILAFFAGTIHGRVRPVLLNHWDEDPDMKIYGPLPDRVSRKMNYIQHMKTSKYCICPMGFEVNSPRIVEAIYYECVPVIIADNFVLPFEEVLDWSAFAVVIAEKDIPNLKDILLAIPLRRYLKMHTCVKMLQKHFLWHPRPVKYDIFHMILHSIWLSRLNQIQVEE